MMSHGEDGSRIVNLSAQLWRRVNSVLNIIVAVRENSD